MQLQTHLLALLAPAIAAAAWTRQAQAPLRPQTHLSSSAPPTVAIPLLGFGTWNLAKHNASKAVSTAIQVGYRHIDCAEAYGNEKEVGEGIADGLNKTGLSRDDLWVTSKLWNSDHGYDNVEPALDKTLTNLGVGYLDLYLMHWPVAKGLDGNKIEYLDTWRGLESLLPSGKVLNLGVSNFDLYQLSALQLASIHKPLVHQMELHPYLQQWDFLHFHRSLGIAVTAYSPLANLNPVYTPRPGTTPFAPPSILQNKVIGGIAEKRGCTNAQVALAWGMERGTSVIPKSEKAEHILEDFEAQDCQLNGEDFEEIEEMGRNMTMRYNKQGGFGVRLWEGLEDPGV